MKYSVNYSDEALDDLRDIYSYISESLMEPTIAAGQVNRIRTEIKALDRLPFRHSVVDWEPWHTMEMRHFPVDNFVVFYLGEDKSVNVVRIFYGRRDIESIIKNSK